MHYNIHTHTFTNNSKVVELVNQYPNKVDVNLPTFTVGIHPWYLNEISYLDDLLIIENNIKNKKFKAVGECGLDKRIDTSIKIQKKILIPQLLLAEKYKKPVILHCVAAFQEIIEIKKELQLTIPMVVHGFSKNTQVAESLLKHGFYLSFGKYLLQNPELEKVLQMIPLQQLFLETDMITQTIFDVYDKASHVLNCNLEPIIEENFNRVFNQ